MNWCGFPVGFRFAAKEITDAFKKQCWETVLKAASYADTADMFLHETVLDDPYAEMQIYIAVIGSPNVGPLQKDAEMWRRDTALAGHLTFYRPLVQENYLELYAPTHSIGTFLPDGSIKPDEGVAFLPKRPDKTCFQKKTRKAVFLSRIGENENTDANYAAAMRKLSEHGPAFEVARLNYTEGPRALYYAAAFRKALLYKYSYKTIDGERKELTYALLPGGRCLADARALQGNEATGNILKSFLTDITGWHGKGATVLTDKDASFDWPEGCEPTAELRRFYGFEAEMKTTDALFCTKQDAAYFKEELKTIPIEV